MKLLQGSSCNNCEDCLWADQCGCQMICDNFSSIDEFDDRFIDNYIEVKRYEFYKEWIAYLKSIKENV